MPVGADIIRPFVPETAGLVGRDDSVNPMGPPRRPNEVVGVGRRRPSGGNELSRLRGSERSAAWADDVGATCGRPLDVGGFFRGARRLGAPYHLLTIHRGLPPWDAPTRRAPPFLPEEMGGKKGRGASPIFEVASHGFSSKAPPAPSTLDPEPMAAVGCDWLERTGPASPPAPLAGACGNWGPRRSPAKRVRWGEEAQRRE